MEIFGNADLNSSALTSSPAASPARTSPRPANESESREIARGFGLNSPALLGFWDLATCSLRTCQVSWIDGQCPELSENWPDSGMWDAGAAFELQSLAPPISENEFSLWPTAVARDDGKTPGAHLAMKQRIGERDGTGANRTASESCGNHPNSEGDSLTGVTKLWRTPDAPGSGGPRNRQESTEQGHQYTIAEQAEHWATPNAHDSTDARGKGFELTDHHYSPHDLVAQTDTWNTPHGMSNRDRMGKLAGCGGGEFGNQVSNWQTPGTDSFRSRGGDRTDEMGLDQQARFFPTPASRDYRTPNATSYQERSQTAKGEQLQNFVAHSLPVPPAQTGPESSESAPTLRRRLNPRFVEWLMGFPIGWTEL